MDEQMQSHDHDLLIEIKAKLEALLISMTAAGIPAACAVHTQRLEALEARAKVSETRFWTLVSGVVLAVIAGAISLLFKGGQ